MSKHFVYVDQNIISHFCCESDSSYWNAFREKGLTIIVSELHLTEICLSADPLSFAMPAERLGAYFLSSAREAVLVKDGRVELEPFDAKKEIALHKENIAEVERSFLQSLLPMLKMSGGLSDIEKHEIEDKFVDSMKYSIEVLLRDFGPLLRFFFSGYFKARLWVAERAIRKSFAKIDFEKDAAMIAAVRKRIHAAGGISHVLPEERVQKAFSFFEDDERERLQKDFPKGFGKEPNDCAAKILQLAFLLFTVGAVPNSGKVFRGKNDDQKKRYRAQFLDCMHIGKASLFSAFLTNDSGAHWLAQAVFAYAGVATQSIELTRTTTPA